MAFATSSDGSLIYYEIEGTGNPTLLFVYGAGCFIDYWQFQRELSKSFQLVFCDLAGHGKSTSNRDTYTMEAFAQDVSSVIEHADLQNVILVGWSMGGPIILEAAMINTKIKGIIGVDTFFPWGGSGYTKASSSEIKQWDNFSERFRTNDQNAFFKAYTDWFRQFFENGKKVENNTKQKLLNLGKNMSSTVFVSEVEQMLSWDVLETAQKVSQPIKTIMAGLSVPNPEKREKFTKEGNRVLDFNAVFLEDVSHVLMIQDPEKFNKVIHEMASEIISPI